MISSENNLQKELDHLRTVFCDINDYPENVTKKIISEEIARNQSPPEPESTSGEAEEPEKVQLNLPYGG